MSYKKAALIYSLAVIVQFSMLNLVAVFGTTPNLILCLALFITYKYNDGIRPALVGVPFALLTDLLGGQYVGVAALMIFILCLSTAYFGRDLNRDNILTLLSVMALGTVLYYLGYWMILAMLGDPTTILRIMEFLLVEIPLNLLVAAMAYWILNKNSRPGKSVAGGLINMVGKGKHKMNIRYTR